MSTSSEPSGQLDDGPVVVSAWAPWCNNCKAMEPLVAEVERDHAARLVRVRVDESPDLVDRFGLKSVPVLIALNDGQETGRLVGVHTTSAIASLFEAAADPASKVDTSPPGSLTAIRGAAGAALLGAGIIMSTVPLVAIGGALCLWALSGFARGWLGSRR